MTRNKLIDQLDLLACGDESFSFDDMPNPKERKSTTKKIAIGGKTLAERRRDLELSTGENSNTLGPAFSYKKPTKKMNSSIPSSISTFTNQAKNMSIEKEKVFKSNKSLPKTSHMGSPKQRSTSQKSNPVHKTKNPIKVEQMKTIFAAQPKETSKSGTGQTENSFKSKLNYSSNPFLDNLSNLYTESSDIESDNNSMTEELISNHTTNTSIFALSPKGKRSKERSQFKNELRIGESTVSNMSNVLTCIEAMIEADNELIQNQLEDFVQFIQESVPHNTYTVPISF